MNVKADPIVKLRIRRHWQQLRDNPRWFVMDLISRFFIVRNVLKFFRKPSAKGFHDESTSVFDFDGEAALRGLNKDGYAPGLNLPPEIVTEIRDFAMTQPCYGNGKAQLGFVYPERAAAEDTAGEHFSQAVFLHHDKHLDVVNRLAADPRLLKLISRYFNGDPVFVGSRLWWTFCSNEENFDTTNTSAFFHFDKDDYSGVRVFFYLTDVDTQTGPHMLIKGSHKHKRISQMLSLGERSQPQMRGKYRDDQFVTVCGPAGTGFIEDPFTFHSATRPIARDRLILQLRYATRIYDVFPTPAESELQLIST